MKKHIALLLTMLFVSYQIRPISLYLTEVENNTNDELSIVTLGLTFEKIKSGENKHLKIVGEYKLADGKLALNHKNFLTYITYDEVENVITISDTKINDGKSQLNTNNLQLKNYDVSYKIKMKFNSKKDPYSIEHYEISFSIFKECNEKKIRKRPSSKRYFSFKRSPK
jgi:hypothetical protein